MTVDEINQKYTQACAEAGDLAFKLMDLQEQRTGIDQQISDLQRRVEAYRKVRADLQQAMNEAEKPAKEAQPDHV